MKILVTTKKHKYNITNLIEFLSLSTVFWSLIAIGCYLEGLI